MNRTAVGAAIAAGMAAINVSAVRIPSAARMIVATTVVARGAR
jgi:hypothetical protein